MTTTRNFQVQIDVRVHDLEQLRAFAFKRASDAGLHAAFEEGERLEEPEERTAYWIGWLFDAGTPDGCGLEIQDSGVEPIW